MANGIVGIDHALIGVRDLEAARLTYARLGFTPTPRGRHVGWGTANYCLMFAGNYVELLGVVDPKQPSAGLPEQLRREGEGLLRVALGARDAEASRAALVANGIEPSPVERLSRALELPTGAVQPAFALVYLPANATPGLSAFLCQHLTPELMRRPEWLRHANGAVALAAVTAVVENPGALQAAYERLFGAGTTVMTDATLSVFTALGAILLVTPTDLAVLHPEVDLGPARSPPYLAALRFQVADPAATARHLTEAGVPFSQGHDGAVRVAPAAARGVILEFAAD